ncbi:GNAT family N-acetyltransferase [Spirillospora sp. NPDC050679]
MTGFDGLVDQAWPAFEHVAAHGWRLRYAGGVTKRANSVWPAADPGDLEAAIAAAERFYTARGAAPVFSVSPSARPAALDAELERRGYALADPTLVMTADLLPGPPPDRPVEIADAPSPAWLEVWWSVDGRYADALPTAERIVTGVPAFYAMTGDAVGRAVPQGDWLGVYCMAVAPESRRRGLARDVLRALLDEGRKRGARRAYLCVTEANSGAQALYEKAGFRTETRYHYRVAR